MLPDTEPRRASRTLPVVLGGFVLGFALLLACTRPNGGVEAPTSALQIRASIEPEPVVGQAVIWHNELFSGGPEFQDTRLKLELPEGVELVSGDANWQGTVPADGTAVVVDLVIRVTTPGEWRITATAYSIRGPGTTTAGWKTLYITSSGTSAEVIQDVNWVGTPIPNPQIPPSPTPELSTAVATPAAL